MIASVNIGHGMYYNYVGDNGLVNPVFDSHNHGGGNAQYSVVLRCICKVLKRFCKVEDE